MLNMNLIIYLSFGIILLLTTIFNILYLYGANRAEQTIDIKTPIIIKRISRIQVITALAILFIISMAPLFTKSI